MAGCAHPLGAVHLVLEDLARADHQLLDHEHAIRLQKYAQMRKHSDSDLIRHMLQHRAYPHEGVATSLVEHGVIRAVTGSKECVHQRKISSRRRSVLSAHLGDGEGRTRRIEAHHVEEVLKHEYCIIALSTAHVQGWSCVIELVGIKGGDKVGIRASIVPQHADPVGDG